MLKNKSRNIKGITLIALVITIIVLLILAGITINMITSQDGILSKTILAKGKMNEAEIEEKIKLAVTKAQINENGLDKNELKDELNKYFGDKYTLTENSDGSCVIEVEGVIYKVDSSGNILNGKYELATSEDGTISDSSGDSLSNYIIYGNSIQNGEPSPENPVEIESVGDKTKNLIDIDSMLNDCLIKNEDGSYTIKKISSGNRMSKTLYVNIPADTYICLSGKVLEYNGTYNYPVQVVCDLEDGSHVTLGIKEEKSWITKYEKEIKAIRIYQEGAMPDGTYAKFKNLQLEIGKEPTEYEPYGYKIPIKVKEKNLFDINKISTFVGANYTTSRKTYSLISDGIITSKIGLYAAGAYLYDSKITLSAGTYTVSADFMADKDSGSKGVAIGGYDIINQVKKYGYKTLDNYRTWERKSYTFTLDAQTDISILTQGIGNKDDDTNLNIKIKNIQLEEGDVETSYEPYQEREINIYLSEPLRKVGDYADYIDFKNKKVIRKIATKLLNGNEVWKYEKLDYGNNFYTNIKDALGNQYIPIFSNKFKYYTNGILSNNFSCRISSSKNLNLRYQGYDNADKFKEWITLNNVEIVYQLATPLEQTIELPNILTGKGNNKVTIGTKIQPSKIELTYYKLK